MEILIQGAGEVSQMTTPPTSLMLVEEDSEVECVRYQDLRATLYQCYEFLQVLYAVHIAPYCWTCCGPSTQTSSRILHNKAVTIYLVKQQQMVKSID